MLDLAKHPANNSKPLPVLQKKSVLYTLIKAVALIIAVFTLVNLATLRFVVDGTSMSPAFETGQYLIVSRVHYLIAKPQRGDVLVFHLPLDPERDFIKRIIALPGDTVEFRDTEVYINGIILDEPYIKEACDASACGDSFWQIGLDEYFVMGDNRNHSDDSRFFGTINIDLIVGKAFLRYYPFSEFGWLHRIGLNDG